MIKIVNKKEYERLLDIEQRYKRLIAIERYENTEGRKQIEAFARKKENCIGYDPCSGLIGKVAWEMRKLHDTYQRKVDEAEAQLRSLRNYMDMGGKRD